MYGAVCAVYSSACQFIVLWYYVKTAKHTIEIFSLPNCFDKITTVVILSRDRITTVALSW